MKFEIPRITRALNLAEYAPEWQSLAIHVWVNPPMKLLQEYDQALATARQAIKDGLVEGYSAEEAILKVASDLKRIFAELWSQGPEDTHWTPEEVEQLVAETAETDPGLWLWLRNRSIELIKAHRQQIKKD